MERVLKVILYQFSCIASITASYRIIHQLAWQKETMPKGVLHLYHISRTRISSPEEILETNFRSSIILHSVIRCPITPNRPTVEKTPPRPTNHHRSSHKRMKKTSSKSQNRVTASCPKPSRHHADAGGSWKKGNVLRCRKKSVGKLCSAPL